jgi:predicted nucleotidyltransferase
MRFGLSDIVVSRIIQVFTQFPQVEKVILYGSRAKGNYKKGSDIDLVIEGNNITISCLAKIRNAIDDLLLPYTVDLCVFETIDNPSLIEHINRVGIVLYKKYR